MMVCSRRLRRAQGPSTAVERSGFRLFESQPILAQRSDSAGDVPPLAGRLPVDPRSRVAPGPTRGGDAVAEARESRPPPSGRVMRPKRIPAGFPSASEFVYSEGSAPAESKPPNHGVSADLPSAAAFGVRSDPPRRGFPRARPARRPGRPPGPRPARRAASLRVRDRVASTERPDRGARRRGRRQASDRAPPGDRREVRRSECVSPAAARGQGLDDVLGRGGAARARPSGDRGVGLLGPAECCSRASSSRR